MNEQVIAAVTDDVGRPMVFLSDGRVYLGMDFNIIRKVGETATCYGAWVEIPPVPGTSRARDEMSAPHFLPVPPAQVVPHRV